MTSLSNSNFEQNQSEHVSTGDSSKINEASLNSLDKLQHYFYQQLEHFKEWNDKRDWLAFHHHHYDWWMFPSE